MPDSKIATRIRESLEKVRDTDLENSELIDVLRLAQQLTNTMQIFFGSLDQTIHEEFHTIASHISRTRDEIAALRPNDIKEQRIPIAGAELEAVVEDTEKATEVIMAEAEAIMGLEIDPSNPDVYQNSVNEAMYRIIEACSFQDLAGQRVSKAIMSLKHIEERVARFASTIGVTDAEMGESERAEFERRQEVLLHGPARGGPETEQSAVDDIMGMDQDSIDALFD